MVAAAGFLIIAASAVPPTIDCLPGWRQGGTAVSWRDSVLLVGGSTSPGQCKPPYTELSSVLMGSSQEGTWGWQVLGAQMPSGRTHVGAAIVDETLFVLGGYGPGPCIHSPSKGKCAHSTVWALDLQNLAAGFVSKAPMAYNRSNFGIAVFNSKIITAGGYGNYGIAYGQGTSSFLGNGGGESSVDPRACG